MEILSPVCGWLQKYFCIKTYYKNILNIKKIPLMDSGRFKILPPLNVASNFHWRAIKKFRQCSQSHGCVLANKKYQNSLWNSYFYRPWSYLRLLKNLPLLLTTNNASSKKIITTFKKIIIRSYGGCAKKKLYVNSGDIIYNCLGIIYNILPALILTYRTHNVRKEF